MAYEKHYVGNGKQVKDFADLVEMSICIDDAEKFIYTFAGNGKRYLKLTVARRKSPDNYGHTHTAYVNERIFESDPAQKTIEPVSVPNLTGRTDEKLNGKKASRRKKVA